MKILTIGANGTMGKAVVEELSKRHEIVSASRKSGDYRVDIKDLQSVRDLFQKTAKVDAVVSAAGSVHFGALADMTTELFDVGLRDKLMGQVNIVMVAPQYLNPGGSITLVAGTLSEDPIRYGSSASMVNGAIESFAIAAAVELPPGLRINVVSPSLLVESIESYGPYFRGVDAVPAKRVALAFSKSVEGAQTGKVYRVE
ncbi:MAG: short chain dehydrogenase [Candidatus Eremiobacteraeota bacterium]|nr:short chain dehydrogenase [Candidatus Eremiobacteraeota bacterium]MBC5827234.1 short chain dehydrogenase [Candidatus Eremiobacteraeota bacterium]